MMSSGYSLAIRSSICIRHSILSCIASKNRSCHSTISSLTSDSFPVLRRCSNTSNSEPSMSSFKITWSSGDIALSIQSDKSRHTTNSLDSPSLISTMLFFSYSFSLSSLHLKYVFMMLSQKTPALVVGDECDPTKNLTKE